MIAKNLIRGLAAASLPAILMLGFAGHASAETRVTYKSAKTATSYYQMAVQLAEGVKKSSNGDISVTVEESQGSVQNVKEAAKRTGNYVFTTPPSLVKMAMAGQKLFSKEGAGAYKGVRSLFPIPYLTMHFVVRADAGIHSFADLAGKKFLIGKGSFGAREADKYLKMFGVLDKVDLVGVELNAAVPALKNRQIDGFATAGSYPAPNVIEAAASVKIDLLSLSDKQIAETKRDELVIPAGTYPGVDHDTSTTTLPVGAYTTTHMDDATAYELTKSFWEGKKAMARDAKWWAGVTFQNIATLGAPLHPGALRYYEEKGVTIPAGLK